jgi:hypothetical protein
MRKNKHIHVISLRKLINGLLIKKYLAVESDVIEECFSCMADSSVDY